MSRFYKFHKVFMCLIVHLILGYRMLRDLDYYRDDPLVRQVLGMHPLPSVPTMSRMLGEVDCQSLERMREMNHFVCLSRLQEEGIKRITLDLDGSVQSTSRHAEGTAVGFNKKKKGERSYYPLLATIAQTGQIFDFLHRNGNVHDSNGAVEFLRYCVEKIRKALPDVQIELRADSAFFSDQMVSQRQRPWAWNIRSRCLSSGLWNSRASSRSAVAGPEPETEREKLITSKSAGSQKVGRAKRAFEP